MNGREFVMKYRSELAKVLAEASPRLVKLATCELAKRKGMVVPDSDSATELVAESVSWLDSYFEHYGESNYRRGYWHGFDAAMDDLQPACSAEAWSRLCDFFNEELTPWRFDDEASSTDQPPKASTRGTH